MAETPFVKSYVEILRPEFFSKCVDFESCSELSPDQFKQICNERLKNYLSLWHDLQCCDTSIIRPYRLYKLNFGTECYLKHNSTFRAALSKLRTSSHNLKIERGHYTRPVLNVNQRQCMACDIVEDEEDFGYFSFFQLRFYWTIRVLMRCSDPQILAWFGKCVHHSFGYNSHTRWGQGVIFLRLFRCWW